MLTGATFFLVIVAEPAFKQAGPGSSAAIMRVRRSFVRLCWTALGLAVATGTGWLFLLAIRLSGGSLADGIAEQAPLTLLTQTQFGATWLVRLIIAALMTVPLARRHPARGWRTPFDGGLALLLSAALIGTLAWAGHGGAGGPIEVAGDAAHLMAAGVWVGGLVPLASASWPSRLICVSHDAMVALNRWCGQLTKRYLSLRTSSLTCLISSLLTLRGSNA